MSWPTTRQILWFMGAAESRAGESVIPSTSKKASLQEMVILWSPNVRAQLCCVPVICLIFNYFHVNSEV